MAPKRKARRPPLEVVSQFDGAWYDGDVSLEGSCLRVHFNGFGHEVDEFWDEEFLKSPTKVKEIIRLRSKQMQDSQCTKVAVGMIVCANFKTTNGEESKYYDAKILMVDHNQHSLLKNGRKELCNCRFKLMWENGPSKHKEVYLGCVDISFIDDENVEKHPLVHEIFQTAYAYTQKSENKNVQKQLEYMELQQFPSPQDVKENENVPMQLEQDLSTQDIHMQVQFEQVLPIEHVQAPSQQILSIENVPMHHGDSLDDGLSSRGTNEGLFSSMDMEGLPNDIIQKVENYNNFHKFLGEEADKLKEALETYNFKNNISIL